MFRTYARAMEYLNRATDYERQQARYSPATYDLDRMRRFAAALGNIERSFKSLHIAGTKGKGSVAHLAEAILRQAGYRTGLYTSPHLVDLRERIRLDGKPVSERDFVWAMDRMERAMRRLRPTFFEIMTQAAFLLFARERVDYAVVEVGLGGRLDATNVLTPVACAITLIDYDHMDKLGHTLGEIAREKAAILKPGIPVVTGAQRPAALREIRRRSDPLIPRVWAPARPGTVVKFKVAGLRGRRYRCELPLLGRHQAENAAIAIGLVEASGAEVTPEDVRGAFRRVRLPGRIEIVGRRPWILVDSAHNPVSARALAEALRAVPRRRTILVFGASADKDWPGMLRALPGMALSIFTRARSPRAVEPGTMMRLARGPAARTRSVEEALALARKVAGPADAIVVAGSFYVAGEALAWLSRTT